MRGRRVRSDRGLTVVRALLLVGAVVLIGVLAYRQISRLMETRVPVWVTATALRAGQVVSQAHLKVLELPTPSGALALRSEIEGRTLAQDKPEGQPFYSRDLAPRPAAPRLSTTIPQGRVLATVRVGSMDLPIPELYAGDRLDIMLATSKGVEAIARNAQVMGTMNSRAGGQPAVDSGRILGVDISIPGANPPSAPEQSLVLALFPADVYPLAAAEATGQKMKIILHSDEAVRSGTLLDVRPPTPAPVRSAPARPTVELLLGGKVERIAVR
jgi:Flp pilus assembly protein CpaB